MQTRKRFDKKASYLVLALVLVLLLCASVLTPAPALAQSWPASWIQIDSDPNESGPGNDYRDVIRAFYNYDSNYLYLRLETWNTPGFPNVGSRFKWLIDVGIGSNMYFSGQNILGSEYIIMLEDSDNDGGRDVYLLDADGDDNYAQYEPAIYKTNPGPVTNTTIAGYNLPGPDNYVDLYVSFSALGGPDVSDVSLVWATDQENPNLEQGPIVDSLDFSDTPILLNADLNVLKDVNEHNPSANDPITYTVTVTNTGPADATNIELTDQLPAGVTFQSYSSSQGSYSSITHIWSVGTLANEGIATLTILATVNDPFNLEWTNTANITAVDQPDPHVGDNSDSADIFPGAVPDEADLSVSKDVDKHLPVEGDTITYTFIVTNTGPATATTINMTDSLPGGFTYQSDSPSQGNYDSGTGIWSIGTLADGDSATLTVTATVSGAAGLHVFNTATVVGDQDDPHTLDNSDDAAFDVQAPAPVVATGVPVFPSMYVGLAAALGAGVIAYLLRRRVLGQKTSEI